MKKLILIILSLSTLLSARNNVGLSFLKIGVGAGELSLAEAVTSKMVSPFSFYYNPALLSQSEKSFIGFTHNEWIADVRSEFLTANFSLFDFPINFSITSTSVSDIEIRTKPGEKEGSFNSHYASFNFSTAKEIIQNLSIGITAKYIYENIFVYEASGYAFDLGFWYRNLFEMFNTSLVFRNLGSMSELRNEQTKLPHEIRVGISPSNTFDLASFSFTPMIEYKKVFDTDISNFSLGLETLYDNLIALRLGYKFGSDLNSFTVGLGVNWKGVAVDYAYLPFSSNFGSANIISIFIGL